MVMVGMLIAGTCNTILMKIQNSTPVDPDDPKKTFNHPFVQCAIMFLGECLCLVLYGIKLLYNKHKAKTQSSMVVPTSPGTQQAEMLHLKTNINPLLLAIPAAFDIVASTLMNIALTMVAASVYQMLRGMIIIITAIMAIIFLKKKLYRHHWTSIVVIFTGVFMVGIAALFMKTDEEKASKEGETKVFGLILLLLAQLFTGGMFIVEEKLLGDYYLDPLKVVGLEGVWGVLFWAVLLPIFNNIPCDVEGLCNHGVLEDTLEAFREFGNYPVLIGLSVCICFSIAFFNSFGVAVTKNASAAQRSTIDTSRTVLIWIFFLAVPIYSKHLEHFKVLQLFGFIFLVFGTLVYNEILVLPFLGFDQYTRKALKEKEEGEGKGLLDESNTDSQPGYAAVSPHAAYDSKRNERIIQHKMNEIQHNRNMHLNKTEELSITEESEKFSQHK